MPKLFISYRRADSEHIVGRIDDRLSAHFGRDNVFLDIDSIPLGTDFHRRLDEAVGECAVLLAVIGDGWLDAKGPDGRRRLDDPDDFVRIEVAAAIARGTPVVPVLVARAAMPAAHALPEPLKHLASRNATEVRSGRDFHGDVDRLIRGVEVLLAEQARRAAAARVLELDLENPELVLTRRVRCQLLPQAVPDMAGYEFHARYLPAPDARGDFHDFVPLGDGRLAVLIGDMAGRGTPVALLVVKLGCEARFYLLGAPDPVGAVTALNDQMSAGLLGDRFATLVVMVLDPRDHTVTVVNAGHLGPRLYRAATREVVDAISLEATGLPIGVMPGFTYEQATFRLEPGDAVAVFSDGVADAMNPAGELFGSEAADRCLLPGDAPADDQRPRRLGERLEVAARAHLGDAAQRDDITIVCFGRLP